MFEVWYCPEDSMLSQRLTVYHVRNDKTGYPQFLVYFENQWRYISAKYFEPFDPYD